VAYYIITDSIDPKNPVQHLVQAKTKAQALSAVVEPRFSVVLAEDDDLIKLSQDGIKPIKA